MGKRKKELKKRILELEKLISQKDEIISILQDEINKNNYIPYYPYPWNPPYIPYVSSVDICIDGQMHDYPDVWFGTMAPSCKKCGKQAVQTTVTYNNQTTDVVKINDDITNNLYFDSGRPYDKIVDDELINEANELLNYEKFFGKTIWKTTTDNTTKIIN